MSGAFDIYADAAESEFGDPYENLREVLAPEYAALPPDVLEEALLPVLGDVSPEEIEGFLNSLKKAVGSVGNVVATAAPGALSGGLQGATAGSALGPYGALAGGLIGALGGGAKSVSAAKSRRGARGRRRGRRSVPAAPTAPSAGSPAAGQLLTLISRPEVLQALMSMLLGSAGNGQVRVGSQALPVGAITNLIGSLANRAAAEHHAVSPTQGPEVPDYLVNEFGEFVCDASDPEARADAALAVFASEIAEEEDWAAADWEADWVEDAVYGDGAVGFEDEDDEDGLDDAYLGLDDVWDDDELLA